MTAIAIGARNRCRRPAERHRQHAGDHGDRRHDDRPGALVAGLEQRRRAGSLPARISSIAKSTSRIEFLATMPISMSKPITTGSENGFPVRTSASTAPPKDSGSAERIVIG